jgi:hypothetical protein
MKSRFRAKRAIAVALVAVVLLMPMPANAGIQDIILLLDTIGNTLKTAVGEVLGSIQAISSSLRAYEQNILWPVSLIDQAKAEVSQVRAQLSSLFAQAESPVINSATLSAPKTLETLLRSRSASGLGPLASAYGQVFQSVPAATATTPGQRNLADADDALALDALKLAVVSDTASDQTSRVADRLEQQVAVSSPGSAPMLSAQAGVANLQNQAMLHRLLAAELREQAALLAHGNALRKQSADANRDLRNNLLRILSR